MLRATVLVQAEVVEQLRSIAHSDDAEHFRRACRRRLCAPQAQITTAELSIASMMAPLLRSGQSPSGAGCVTRPSGSVERSGNRFNTSSAPNFAPAGAKFGALEVLNLFPLRSTDPDGLVTHPAPLGDWPDRNNGAIMDAIDNSAVVICAWGAHRRRRHARRKCSASSECAIERSCSTTSA